MQHLLYFGQAPNYGTGSPVSLLRHLRMFAAGGWRITIIPNWGDGVETCDREGWRVIDLPHRRRWWPPYRPRLAWSRRLTAHLWAREVDRLVKQRPDAVLTYLAWHTDLMAEIGAAYGRLTRVPVTCIVHDDALDFTTDPAVCRQLVPRRARILRSSHRNWFVSPEQAEAIAPSGAHRGVLAPIPEGWSGQKAAWRYEFAQERRIFFAGYVWPAQAWLLAKLAPAIAAGGGRLVVLSRPSAETDALVATGLVDHVPPFPENRDALLHLTQHAAGLLVSYAESLEELPWTRTSMPSKLIEYSHLGLPILIVAPAETAVAKWAARRDFGACFSPDDSAAVTRWVRSLGEEPVWRSERSAWQELAAGEWAAQVIHRKLSGGLLRSEPGGAKA